MENKLHKVNVEVDVYVMAKDLTEAASIARLHAGQEVAEFGLAHASEVESIYSIPEGWQNVMPYSKDDSEKRSCGVIMKVAKDKAKEPEPPPTSNIKEEKHVAPEPEEDLPVQLPVHNQDLPQLRFKI